MDVYCVFAVLATMSESRDVADCYDVVVAVASTKLAISKAENLKV